MFSVVWRWLKEQLIIPSEVCFTRGQMLTSSGGPLCSACTFLLFCSLGYAPKADHKLYKVTMSDTVFSRVSACWESLVRRKGPISPSSCLDVCSYLRMGSQACVLRWQEEISHRTGWAMPLLPTRLQLLPLPSLSSLLRRTTFTRLRQNVWSISTVLQPPALAYPQFLLLLPMWLSWSSSSA